MVGSHLLPLGCGEGVAWRFGEFGVGTVASAVMVVFLGRHLPALLGLFKKKGKWVWLRGLERRDPQHFHLPDPWVEWGIKAREG